MDISEQLTKSELLLEDRICRTCGENKNLLDGYYKSRKNPALASSYSYECKVCTLKRVNDYNKVNKKYKIGKCIICEDDNVKIMNNLCKGCGKLVNYDVDILQKAVLYLRKNK
tara:strand:+ start:447 stop:785 length:339 start_codon:yes stop_codon:yes gene_type:complete